MDRHYRAPLALGARGGVFADPSYRPGLAAAVAVVVGSGAVFALVVRGAGVDRFILLRTAAAGARRSPPSGSLSQRAALFVTVGAPRLRVAVGAVAWAALVAGSAVLFRTLWLPLAVAVAAVIHLQGLAPLRVGVGPNGATVNSHLGWRLAQVPLDVVTAAGSTYLDVTSPAGAVAGRLHGRRMLLAAWVRRNGPALTLNLAGGGLVVVGMAEAERAAGLVAGLAGLDRATTASATPWPADLLEPATYQEVVALVEQRRELAAVRLVRDRTSLGMGEARRAVEAIAVRSR